MHRSLVIFTSLAALILSAAEGPCSSPYDTALCTCLETAACKTLGGQPVRGTAGRWPCPDDPHSVWGCSRTSTGMSTSPPLTTSSPYPSLPSSTTVPSSPPTSPTFPPDTLTFSQSPTSTASTTASDTPIGGTGGPSQQDGQDSPHSNRIALGVGLGVGIPSVMVAMLAWCWPRPRPPHKTFTDTTAPSPPQPMSCVASTQLPRNTSNIPHKSPIRL